MKLEDTLKKIFKAVEKSDKVFEETEQTAVSLGSSKADKGEEKKSEIPVMTKEEADALLRSVEETSEQSEPIPPPLAPIIPEPAPESTPEEKEVAKETEDEILARLGLKKGQSVKLSENYWNESKKGKSGKISEVDEYGNLIIEDEDSRYLSSIGRDDLTLKGISRNLILEPVEELSAQKEKPNDQIGESAEAPKPKEEIGMENEILEGETKKAREAAASEFVERRDSLKQEAAQRIAEARLKIESKQKREKEEKEPEIEEPEMEKEKVIKRFDKLLGEYVDKYSEEISSNPDILDEKKDQIADMLQKILNNLEKMDKLVENQPLR